MNARDAEALLVKAVPRGAGVWADWGAGTGTFTRGLARLLGPGSRIYAVDRDPDAIASLQRSDIPAGVEIVVLGHDFTYTSALPGVAELDGMLFANSLHFVPKPDVTLSRLVKLLRPGGRVVIVEYDGRRPNRWVPYPISIARLADVTAAAGLATPAITATRPSAYGGALYVAVTGTDREPAARGIRSC